jgi:hypothetical protein
MPITFTIQDLSVHSPDDISITLSGDGVSVSLSATQTELLSCGTSGCTARVMLTLPSEEPEGTKVVTFASKSCPASQIPVTGYVASTKAVPYPNRVSNLGGDTVALYVENAPHSSQLPFNRKNVKVVCAPNDGSQSMQGTIESVSEWTRDQTRVVMRSPPAVLQSDKNTLAVTCRVYRSADGTKAGAGFVMTLYRGNVPYIEGNDDLQAQAVGNQYGGKQLRVHVMNFPRVQVIIVLCVPISTHVWYTHV